LVIIAGRIISQNKRYKLIQSQISTNMKSRIFQTLTVILVVSAGMMSCNPLGKMAKNANMVRYTLTPNPLEMHGDSVAISVSGKFPPKYFHKKAKVTATPVVMNGSTVVKEFPSVELQGEAADGNGQKINFASGGSFTYSEQIPYAEGMENVELFVKVTAGYKTKTKEFNSEKVGDGTIITPMWVQNDDRPILGKDKFTKVIPRSVDADIHYLVNSANVRPAQLKEEDMTVLKSFLEMGIEKEYTWMDVSISAYASPDGEISLNENLANDRANSSAKSVGNMMKRMKIEAAKGEGFYKKQGKGEDWDGFKRKMQASTISDKATIIRILEMYPDKNKREEEIKKIAATYTEVAEKILPELRRAQITIHAEERSKTDAEISALVKSAPETLTVEEMLYAATLVNKLEEKMAIYKKTAEVHNNDWRGPNNVGYMHIIQNNIADAGKAFDKAAAMAPTNSIVKNNQGVVKRLNGDRAGAMAMYEAAGGAGRDVNYNMGIVNIMDGNYESAISNMAGANTFNAALGKLLNGDTDGAVNTVDGSDDKNTAIGYYLKAITGARTDNKDMMLNNLKSAISQDASLKEKAKKDAEFIKHNNSSEFDALVN